MKTALALGPDRPVRWDEFRQRIRAHQPSDLLPAIAVLPCFDLGATPVTFGAEHHAQLLRLALRG